METQSWFKPTHFHISPNTIHTTQITQIRKYKVKIDGTTAVRSNGYPPSSVANTCLMNPTVMARDRKTWRALVKEIK